MADEVAVATPAADPALAGKPAETPLPAPVVELVKVPEPAVDWQARAEAAEIRAELHEQQLALLSRAYGDKIDQSNELVTAQGEAIKTGDWTAYEALVRQNNEKALVAAQKVSDQLVIDKAVSAIEKIAKAVGKDFVDDPVFEAARVAWRKGDFAEAVVQAAEVRAKLAEDGTAAERKATAKAVSEARAAAVKETEERLGKFDNSAGPEAGGSGSNYMQKLKSGDALPNAEEIDRLTAKYLR